MVAQETIVLGDLGDGSRLKARTRTTSRGTKTRYTVDFEAEPLVHVFDDTALGAGPAEAIKDELTEAIQQISASAKPATIMRRGRYALDGDSPSYQARYAGGRMGEIRPGTAGKGTLFNDSGRLAKGVHVRQNPRERSFTINAPANRLTNEYFVHHLASLVPEIQNPRLLLNAPEVEQAIRDSINLLVAKARDMRDAKLKELQQKRINALKALFGLGRAVAGA